MEIQLSLGFTIEINEAGRFELPGDRTYSTSELNKIARDVNRYLRKSSIEQLIGGESDV